MKCDNLIIHSQKIENLKNAVFSEILQPESKEKEINNKFTHRFNYRGMKNIRSNFTSLFLHKAVSIFVCDMMYCWLMTGWMLNIFWMLNMFWIDWLREKVKEVMMMMMVIA